MLNHLLVWIAENDLRLFLYNLSGNVSNVVALLFCIFWYRKKLKMGFFKSVGLFLFWFVALSVSMTAILWINSGFRFTGEQNVASGFILLPLVAILGAKLFRESPDKVGDYFAVPTMIIYFIGRFGCLFYGCCHGYRCDWGIYNPIQNDYRFPIQLLEIFVAFALLALMIYVMKKRNYESDGELLPMLLTLCGAARFLIEYGHDNIKGLLGMSDYAIHALITCIVGIVLWRRKLQKKKKPPVTADAS